MKKGFGALHYIPIGNYDKISEAYAELFCISLRFM